MLQLARGCAAVNQSGSPTLPLASLSLWEEKQSSQSNAVILAYYV